LHLPQLDVLDVLSDHPNSLRHLVNGAQHILGELIEHQMQIPEKRPKCLPVIVLVVCIKHESVGDLTLQVLYDRMVFPILLGDISS
jgi:hypothetical protein